VPLAVQVYSYRKKLHGLSAASLRELVEKELEAMQPYGQGVKGNPLVHPAPNYFNRNYSACASAVRAFSRHAEFVPWVRTALSATSSTVRPDVAGFLAEQYLVCVLHGADAAEKDDSSHPQALVRTLADDLLGHLQFAAAIRLGALLQNRTRLQILSAASGGVSTALVDKDHSLAAGAFRRLNPNGFRTYCNMSLGVGHDFNLDMLDYLRHLATEGGAAGQLRLALSSYEMKQYQIAQMTKLLKASNIDPDEPPAWRPIQSPTISPPMEEIKVEGRGP
jgi:hypothetical protein